VMVVMVNDLEVLVVSQPCYTSAAIVARHASSVSPVNITALIRLDLNRAIAQVTLDYNTATASMLCLCSISVYLGESATCPVTPPPFQPDSAMQVMGTAEIRGEFVLGGG